MSTPISSTEETQEIQSERPSRTDHFEPNFEFNRDSDDYLAKTIIERGIARAKLGDYHAAIKEFSNAIDLDRTSVAVCEAYMERSKARREVGDELGADRDLKDARMVFDRLDTGLEAYDEAEKAYDSRDYKNAIKHYNRALSLLPSLKAGFCQRGIAKRLLEDYRGALLDFEKAIEVNASNSAEAYHQRGLIKFHVLSDAEGALRDYNRAIELAAEEPAFYCSRSILLDAYDGLRDLNRAIELDQTDPSAYLARSLKHCAMNDYHGAICDLSRFIDLAPDGDTILSISGAYSLRAKMNTSLYQYNLALKDHDKAVDLDPSSSEAVFERALIKELLNDHDGAIADFSKAIELEPTNAEAYYRRGMAQADLGLEDAASSDFTKANELGYEEE